LPNFTTPSIAVTVSDAKQPQRLSVVHRSQWTLTSCTSSTIVTALSILSFNLASFMSDMGDNAPRF